MLIENDVFSENKLNKKVSWDILQGIFDFLKQSLVVYISNKAEYIELLYSPAWLAWAKTI
jgi:hypothetical protein